MPNTVGSGLGAQIGIVQEGTVNTPAAVTAFNRLLSSTLSANITTAEDTGLSAGAIDILATRRNLTGLSAAGDVSFNVPSKSFGRWVKSGMGSTATATQISTTGVYQQFHNLGSADGVAHTIQIGSPEVGGTVDPLTLSGCKTTAWELSCDPGGLLMYKPSIFAMNIQPTGAAALGLQTVSFAAADSNFTFAQCSWSSFAAMTVVSGLWTPTTPTALKVRKFSIKGGQPKKVDRTIAGSLFVDEPLGNDFTRATGTIDIDYSATTFQAAYLAGTTLGLQMSADAGVVIGTSGSNHALVVATMPAIKLEQGSTPQVNGPDVITVSYPWTAYNDGTNGSMQIMIQSTDSAV